MRSAIYFTVSFWVYLNSNTDGGTLVHLSILATGTGVPCYNLLALTANGAIVAQLMNNVSNVDDYQGPVLPLNTWTHLALVHGVNSGIRLFVNGEMVLTSHPYAGLPSSYTSMYVTLATPNPQGPSYPTNCPRGSSTGFVSTPFAGAIDDSRIYLRELDAQEICILANM